MNRKELNKTIMMISNWNKPFGLQGFYKNSSALRFNVEHPFTTKQDNNHYILFY